MNGNGRLTRARAILQIEVEGLAAVQQNLDERFGRAIDLLQERRGKIVVIGMGKSGIVGRKVAATLTSTGSPAVFLHPAEGLHGDLGLVQRADVAIVISNSGTSAEIVEILNALKRLTVPIIALTAAPDSPLGRNADVILDVSVPKEACPMNLAPTASTTAAVALGDALAVVLLEEAGFTPEAFGVLHPGGALGRRLRQVNEFMHRGDAVPLVGMQALLPEAIVEISSKRLGVTGVLDEEGRLCGVITDGDVRRTLGRDVDWRALGVAEVMGREPKTIEAEALAESALARMEQFAITCLFVTDAAARPIGLVHLHDLLREKVR